MEYLVMESDNVRRGTTPFLSRPSRAASVGIGYPTREIVEIIREPIYDYGSHLYPSYHRGSRASSVAILENETLRRTGGRRRESTPLSSSSVMTSRYISDTPKYDHYRYRRISGFSPTAPSHIYRPSMWYIGTAGFREDSNEQSRRLQSRMEGLLSYEPPPLDYYINMKQSLRGINERMLQHRQLIDRYAGVDTSPGKSVEERIQDRYYELAERTGLERGTTPAFRSSRAPSEDRSRSVAPSSYRDRASTPSVTTGETSEVRGRIRQLLNRTKRSG